jgi:hypothetical protein
MLLSFLLSNHEHNRGCKIKTSLIFFLMSLAMIALDIGIMSMTCLENINHIEGDKEESSQSFQSIKLYIPN